jgi:hypothetical protein
MNWKNENREIDFDVYDENENGLIVAFLGDSAFV